MFVCCVFVCVDLLCGVCCVWFVVCRVLTVGRYCVLLDDCCSWSVVCWLMFVFVVAVWSALFAVVCCLLFVV